jgi:hypothetical protein
MVAQIEQGDEDEPRLMRSSFPPIPFQDGKRSAVPKKELDLESPIQGTELWLSALDRHFLI